jgi:hypothetical protein
LNAAIERILSLGPFVLRRFFTTPSDFARAFFVPVAKLSPLSPGVWFWGINNGLLRNL